MELGLGLAETLSSFSNGEWWEVSKVLFRTERRARQLGICVKNKWLEKKLATQGSRWEAYRITPTGLAVLDAFKLAHSTSRKPLPYLPLTPSWID